MVLRPPAIETCRAEAGSVVSLRTVSVMKSAQARLSSGLRMSLMAFPAASRSTWMCDASKSICGSAKSLRRRWNQPSLSENRARRARSAPSDVVMRWISVGTKGVSAAIASAYTVSVAICGDRPVTATRMRRG